METVRRRAGDTTWTFRINHSTQDVVVPATGVELVTGKDVDGELTVPAGGYAVVRSSAGAVGGSAGAAARGERGR
ncbi:Beta-galactosidase C-terminal domain [Kribbella sp. NPDC059898]|uniref:Beta-galactosidase C-terminal domain n=1 Tax=Kribbella sp. NPDC059898 TaxID=3346995 RepID=UPI00364B3561